MFGCASAWTRLHCARSSLDVRVRGGDCTARGVCVCVCVGGREGAGMHPKMSRAPEAIMNLNTHMIFTHSDTTVNRSIMSHTSRNHLKRLDGEKE